MVQIWNVSVNTFLDELSLKLYSDVFVNNTNPRCEHLTARWKRVCVFLEPWSELPKSSFVFVKLRHFYVCFGYVHAFCMVFIVWQYPVKHLILPKATKSIKMTNVVPRLLNRVAVWCHHVQVLCHEIFLLVGLFCWSHLEGFLHALFVTVECVFFFFYS